MLSIRRESPRQEDVIDLIRRSDALTQSLYPAESNHLVDVDLLAQSHVHFFVAREVGRGRVGYAERGPFGAYRPDPLSMFMDKRLG